MEQIAEPFLLKNLFSEKFVQQVADEIGESWGDFDKAKFLKFVFDENWVNLELKQRMRHISHGLRACLPADFRVATGVLTETAKRILLQKDERAGFVWCIFPDFVEAFGTDELEISLQTLETLTQLDSAEFAIRPFLLKYPEQTMSQMLLWSEHESHLVRRLASEGFRPRLPWGLGVPYLKTDPSPILPVLENLKNDPSETVRRSVANNLNDISKDHPGLALEIAARWLGQTPETDWVVKHACRGLLKKGNAQALSFFGFEQGAAGIEILDLKTDASVQIGSSLHFSFLIKNTSEQAQKIRLEYTIDYQNASGRGGRKVFNIKSLDYISGAEERIEKRQSFKNFTTRKHFAGAHRLAILVNGEEISAADFWVD